MRYFRRLRVRRNTQGNRCISSEQSARAYATSDSSLFAATSNAPDVSTAHAHPLTSTDHSPQQSRLQQTLHQFASHRLPVCYYPSFGWDWQTLEKIPERHFIVSDYIRYSELYEQARAAGVERQYDGDDGSVFGTRDGRTIVYVQDENPNVLRRIRDLGIRIGTLIGKNDGCCEGGNYECVNDVWFLRDVIATAELPLRYYTDHLGRGLHCNEQTTLSSNLLWDANDLGLWRTPCYPTEFANPRELQPSWFLGHHDTVHQADGMQRIAMIAEELVYLHPEETTSNCLGADDAAGIWLQLRMIDAGVTGTYVVHASEELGGLGSQALIDSEPDWLSERDAVIAFDRRGNSSVITHQRYGRCCSDAFADRVIHMLGPLPTAFRKDPYGSFTDSAHYPDHMERTNLSCGYDAEHTRRESLDLMHLAQLSDRLCQADWSLLNAIRETKHCALSFALPHCEPTN